MSKTGRMNTSKAITTRLRSVPSEWKCKCEAKTNLSLKIRWNMQLRRSFARNLETIKG